jgi:exonuclease III
VARVKLLSWNVAGRTGRLEAQAAAVARREPDIVVLQEIRASTLPRWQGALRDAGLPYSLDSGGRSERRLFNLAASRWPLDPLPPVVCPQPERVLSLAVDAPGTGVEVHGVHVPPANHGLAKVEVCEALFDALAVPGHGPRILVGDLNTPRAEFPDGQIETFAANHPETFERWDRAERSLLTGLADWGFVDVFRHLNGYGSAEATWVFRDRFGRDGGHRLDHLFATRDLDPVSCEYLHGWRETGLSDHSAMETVFADRPASGDRAFVG